MRRFGRGLELPGGPLQGVRGAGHLGDGLADFLDEGVEAGGQPAEVVLALHRQTPGQVALALGDVLEHAVHPPEGAHQRPAHADGHQRAEDQRGHHQPPEQPVDPRHRIVGGLRRLAHGAHDAPLQLAGQVGDARVDAIHGLQAGVARLDQLDHPGRGGLVLLQALQGAVELVLGTLAAAAVAQHGHAALGEAQLALEGLGLLGLVLLQILVEVLAAEQQVAHGRTGIEHGIQVEVLLGVLQHRGQGLLDGRAVLAQLAGDQLLALPAERHQLFAEQPAVFVEQAADLAQQTPALRVVQALGGLCLQRLQALVELGELRLQRGIAGARVLAHGELHAGHAVAELGDLVHARPQVAGHYLHAAGDAAQRQAGDHAQHHQQGAEHDGDDGDLVGDTKIGEPLHERASCSGGRLPCPEPACPPGRNDIARLSLTHACSSRFYAYAAASCVGTA